MHLNANLTFNGQCQAAFHLYQECLGGEITLMLPYGDSPIASTSAPEMHGKILHATLQLGPYTLSGADTTPETYLAPKGFALQLDLHSPEDAQSIFAALAEGGTVQVPLQKTFWADHYAVLTDRFGIPWKINCTVQPASQSAS